MTNDWKKRTPTRQEHVDLFGTWFSKQPKEAQRLINDYIADRIQKSFKMGKSLLDKQIEEIEKMGCLNEFVLPNIYKKTGLVRKSDVLTKLKEL